jgi:hypothetical protein
MYGPVQYESYPPHPAHTNHFRTNTKVSACLCE